MSLFKLTEEKEYVFVEIIKNITVQDLDVLKSDFKKLLLQASDHFIIDFKFVLSLNSQMLAPFILFSKDLKSNKKFVYSINIGANLAKIIQEMGLESVFNPSESKDKVVSKIKSQTQKKFRIDVEFLNPFIRATVQTLETQANCKTEVEKIFIKTPSHAPQIELAAVISINAPIFKGTISLCFPKSVFLHIYESMLGEKHTEITPEIQDGCGELLNIIFGNAKADLNAKNGYTIDRAIPTVLTGDQLNAKLAEVYKKRSAA